MIPIFDAMLEEQQSQGVLWTPSKVGVLAGWCSAGCAALRTHRAHVQARLLTGASAAAASSRKCAPCPVCPPLQMIARLGKEINHPDSIYFWAWKNDIPVFCPALTGGWRSGWVCACVCVWCRAAGATLPPYAPRTEGGRCFAKLCVRVRGSGVCHFALTQAAQAHPCNSSCRAERLGWQPLQMAPWATRCSSPPVQTTTACCLIPPHLACRRLPWRHALLPHLQEPGAGAGHCAGALDGEQRLGCPAGSTVQLPVLCAPAHTGPRGLCAGSCSGCCICCSPVLHVHGVTHLGAAAAPVLQDIRAMNDHAMKAAPRKTGAIILGGGAHIMCWIWDRMRCWHGRCSNCRNTLAACAHCARSRDAAKRSIPCAPHHPSLSLDPHPSQACPSITSATPT